MGIAQTDRQTDTETVRKTDEWENEPTAIRDACVTNCYDSKFTILKKQKSGRRASAQFFGHSLSLFRGNLRVK